MSAPDWKQRWKEDGVVPLYKCVCSIEGDRFIIRHGQEVVYEEGMLCGYAEIAWRIMGEGRIRKTGKPAKWKTIAVFRMVRSAVREMCAQCTGLQDPPTGASKKEIAAWLTIARHYDAVHHGEATF